MNTIEYAIKMEKKDVSYYKKQAKKNKNNSLHTIYNLLADEEKKHTDLLIRLVNNKRYRLDYTDNFSKVLSTFHDKRNLENIDYSLQEKLDICKTEMEKKSETIHLYKNLLMKSLYNDNKNAIIYLIMQEKQQYRVFEDIIKWLSSPDAQPVPSPHEIYINRTTTASAYNF